MPVMRSRGAAAPKPTSTSPRQPPSLQPPSPAAMSSVPPPSSLPPRPPSSASSPLPSEPPPIDSSRSVPLPPPPPPPRRSLRLASSSSSSASSPATAPPVRRSSRGRKRNARVGDPPLEGGGGTSLEPGNKEDSGGASDAPSALVSHETHGGGSRVARTMASVEKRKRSGNQVADVDSAAKSVELIDLEMENAEEERSDVQEEVKGKLSSRANNEKRSDAGKGKGLASNLVWTDDVDDNQEEMDEVYVVDEADSTNHLLAGHSIAREKIIKELQGRHPNLRSKSRVPRGIEIKPIDHKVAEKDRPMTPRYPTRQRQANKGKLLLESHHLFQKDIDIAGEMDITGSELGQPNAKTEYLKRKFTAEEKGKSVLEYEKDQDYASEMDITGSESGQENDMTEYVNTRREFSAEDKGKSLLEYERDLDIAGENIEGLEFGQANAKADYVNTKRKFTAEQKGKSILRFEESPLKASQTKLNMEADSAEENFDAGYMDDTDDDIDIRYSDGWPGMMKRHNNPRREADRAKALKLAPKFAFFKEDSKSAEPEEPEEDSDQESGDMMPHTNHEDWPGPFSTAMKIVKERAERLRARERITLKENEPPKVMIPWTPSKDKSCKSFKRHPPSLKDLTLKVLLDNAEDIESLDSIPDVFKHRLILMLSNLRKITFRLLGLLVSSNPTELHLCDCSWATESQFEELFSTCNLSNLKALQLDLCGRCIPDYLLRAKLAQSPNSLPHLTSVSLRGAYRLSDDGLNALVSSAPSLRSINVSDCSLLTSVGIKNMAEKLEHVLEELYIDDCRHVDAMVILPALKKLKHLEVLSVAGNQYVCNKFVCQLTAACGSNIRELFLAGCQKLTDASMKAIGKHCSTLRAIDIRSLNRLTDSGIQHLADGCRSLQKLQLRRNNFSDEGVAAFLEASGGSLIELSLNNIGKVANHTALTISRRCYSTLRNLDLSFCREMTDEAVGLIVDSCSALEILKLFGCTQITDVFLDGHSNPQVKIIGLKGQLLSEIKIQDYF